MTETLVDRMAADIRDVDGNHDLGAGALAEALVGRGWTKPSPRPALGRRITSSEDVPVGSLVAAANGGRVVYEVLEQRGGRWGQVRLRRHTGTGRSPGWRYQDGYRYVAAEEESDD